MYETYWKLNTKPFQNTPDPRFIYYSGQHQDARLKLDYAIKEGLGAAVLSGIFGCGKTTLLYTILKELNPEKYQTAYIAHPHMDQIELLMSIVSALGDTSLPQKRTEVLRNVIIDRLTNILVNHEREGKKTVVVIDEAHLLTEPLIFEELRLLLNLHLEDKFLLTLILSGQPDLRHKIENLPQFEQRVGVKCYLTNLSREDTEAYILHRLKIAGADRAVDSLFTPRAIELVYEYSGGIPRRINRLCDLSLLEGFTRKTNLIDEKIIEEQAQGLGSIGLVTSPEKSGLPRPVCVQARTGRRQVDWKAQPSGQPVSSVSPESSVAVAEPAPSFPADPGITSERRSPAQVVNHNPSTLRSPANDEQTASSIPRLDDEGSCDLYAALLLLSETFFKQVKLGETLNIQSAVSLITRAIDKITSGDHTLIALAIRPHISEVSREDYLAAHDAVNVAIIGILIGFTRGRDKSSLLRLGLSGLLHNIGMVGPRVASPAVPVPLVHMEVEVKTDSSGAKYVSQLTPLPIPKKEKAVRRDTPRGGKKKYLVLLALLLAVLNGLIAVYTLSLDSFKNIMANFIEWVRKLID